MKRLQTQQLTVTINKKTICHSLNLEVRGGETWGILGPNGCGKTTLLHTFAGIYPAVNGVILLGDDALHTLTIKSIAQFLGILFQDFQENFLQTVFDYCLAARFPHLSYFQRESARDKEIALHALTRMDLADLAHKPIQQLSGGEKRRLALAALLTQTPQVYLLDEPTNHLDIQHQINALNMFKRIAQEESAAILMTLHDVNLAQKFCDHILLMFPDGMTLQGPVQTVLTIENLTKLYQHPLKHIVADNVSLWWPE